ncbi:MAG: hypothetical protein U1E15_12195 [Hyphomicrobiales bacterium]
MGVQRRKGFVFPPQGAQARADKYHMLQHIRMVSGMEGVAVFMRGKQSPRRK